MAVGVNITEAKSRLQATGEGGGTWCRLGKRSQPEKGLEYRAHSFGLYARGSRKSLRVKQHNETPRKVSLFLAS